MTINLVWLRNDLRLKDNLALHHACQDSNAQIIVLFIATPQQWAAHGMAPRQAMWLSQHLILFSQQLEKLGIGFYFHQCSDFTTSVAWLADFCQQNSINNLYFNYQYELNEQRRDEQLIAILADKVSCYRFHDSLFFPPGSVVNQQGECYKVYTPFRNRLVKKIVSQPLAVLPAPINRQHRCELSSKICPRNYIDFGYPLTPIDTDYFPIGEMAAQQRLYDFCTTAVIDYAIQRDFPAVAGTSMLSPYLTIGVLSVRQCLQALYMSQPHIFCDLTLPKLAFASGGIIWLNELIWREFYRHLLVAYPALCCYQPFIAWTKEIQWRNSNDDLQRWQQGLTGYPIIDAAMRQLNTIGWMHNRLRMLTASFLIKDLLLDWRLGEQYFMSQLLDGDLAANNGGWQWAASTGTDSVPYFRIFNPVTQGKRFDPTGKFIRHWLPELAAIANQYIHEPWLSTQAKAIDYPAPIVDHKQARLMTLAAFSQAKQIVSTIK